MLSIFSSRSTRDRAARIKVGEAIDSTACNAKFLHARRAELQRQLTALQTELRELETAMSQTFGMGMVVTGKATLVSTSYRGETLTIAPMPPLAPEHEQQANPPTAIDRAASALATAHAVGTKPQRGA